MEEEISWVQSTDLEKENTLKRKEKEECPLSIAIPPKLNPSLPPPHLYRMEEEISWVPS